MAAAGNAQHIGAREAQQDAFGFSDLDDDAVARKGVLCVVCDGMGGHDGGADASAAAVAAVLDVFGAADAGEAATAVLRRALDAANAAVIDAGRRTGADDAGTTLAAALVRDRSLHWVAVGDTRIVLVRGGLALAVNRDHTLRVELLRRAAAGEGRREDALTDPQRDHLTSSLGVAPLAQVDRSHRGLPLSAGDRVLVMTDGVYRALSPQELVGHLVDDPHAACERVLEAVLGKHDPRQDNATIVAIDVTRGVPTAGDGAAGALVTAARVATDVDRAPAVTVVTTPAAQAALAAARRRRRLGAGAMVLVGAATLAYLLRPRPADDPSTPPAPGAETRVTPAPPAADAVSRELPPAGASPPADRGRAAPPPADRKATP